MSKEKNCPVTSPPSRGGAQRTLEGVLEMVGWRRRDETGVKPTEIEVPSI